MGQEQQEVVFNIFAIISVVALVLSVSGDIKKIIEDNAFEKNYISKDVAFLIDSLYASPENVSFVYSAEANYSILITNEGSYVVSVLDPFGSEGRAFKSVYGENLNFPRKDFFLENFMNFKFTKGNEVLAEGLK